VTHSSTQAAQARHDQLTAALADAKIAAAKASAIARVAGKEERVAASVAAAQAKNEVTRLTDAVKTAARDMKIAAAAAVALEKQAAYRAAEDRRLAQADNPFASEDVSWPALGAWLAGRLKDCVCYVEGTGWGQWVGSHWEFAGIKPSAKLLDLVRRTYALGGDGPVLEKLNANARGGSDLLAHAQGALSLPRERFNTRELSHLVAFRNTTVDLRTGARVRHDPKHYMTGALQCDYNEKADAARIERTFGRFWPKDKETSRCFQLALGYSLTGEVSAKRVMLMVGNQDDALKNGDNGKSMVQNALVRFYGLGVGGWGAAIKSTLIVDTGDRDANSHDGAKTPLIWRRFAIGSEFRNGASIDAGEFNRISGGDVQTARPPHGASAVEFVNVATIWISLNSVPCFKTSDKATRRRLTPFPFTETFYDPEDCPEGGQLKELGLEKWLESRDGMEALGLYIVRGAVAFYAHNSGEAGNLPDSAAMLDLRDRILRAGNPFADIFEEYLSFGPAMDLKKTAVGALLKFATGRRPKPWERDAFVTALKGQGVVEVKVKGERMFRGVGLTVEGRKRLALEGMPVAEFRRAPSLYAAS
jgi:phage/plasmid-associated DNA primase